MTSYRAWLSSLFIIYIMFVYKLISNILKRVKWYCLRISSNNSNTPASNREFNNPKIRWADNCGFPVADPCSIDSRISKASSTFRASPKPLTRSTANSISRRLANIHILITIIHKDVCHISTSRLELIIYGSRGKKSTIAVKIDELIIQRKEMSSRW